MAISDKEAARQIIDALPDEASFEDIRYAIYVRESIERGLRDIEAGNTVSHEEVKREMAAWRESVSRRLVRKGHITVLEPARPVPPLTAELVNDLIDETRGERERRFLGLMDDEV
jgi:predicted transcriptional regulator